MEERIVSIGAIILGVVGLLINFNAYKTGRMYSRKKYYLRDESPFGFWWRLTVWVLASVVFIILGLASIISGEKVFI